jgi:RNA-directed DNA polymerase
VPKIQSKRNLNIKTLDHLSKRLAVPLEILRGVALKAEKLYNSWEEPKKGGGFRRIADPKPELKTIQKAIHRLLMGVRLANCSHGGVKGRSNLTNAGIHAGKKWILNLDFKSFFPNVSYLRVYKLFCKELGCSPDVGSLLTRLCTFNGAIPQGAPTSTDIANLVCRNLDQRLMGLSAKYGNDYSRFVDDLTFSAQLIPYSFINKVKEIISKNGFKLNLEKESLCGRHQPQIVTGLSVNRKRPSVPRETQRRYRAEKHIFEKYESGGMEAELLSKKSQQIKGKINYIKYIKNS